MTHQPHREFENEVRRIARELWNRAAPGGATIADGRERDAVFDEGDIIHILEATTSRQKQKIIDDINKSIALAKVLRSTHPNKLTKIWIITQDDPTAHQREACDSLRKKARCPIEILSIASFSSRLIDSLTYIKCRGAYPFGSVRNPADDRDFNVPEDEYIPLEILDLETNQIHSSSEIAQLMSKLCYKRNILVGDYGSGKSMTMRNIFSIIRQMHESGTIASFPVYLNLRDHYGQSDPSEALIRHGTLIGFPNPHDLVRAWRAGFVHLVLDGFDEVAATRLVRGAKKLQQARRQAMKLISRFVEDSPQNCSIIVSGREHYFDNRDELVLSIGMDNPKLFTLSEFTDDQIRSFLSRKRVDAHIPDWLPSRPLLLGYMVVKVLERDEVRTLNTLSPEEGWDYMLDRICEREARQIDATVIDPSVVRLFIERLATIARNTMSGRGPIDLKTIEDVFEQVFDRPPDDKAEIFILRLPGLTGVVGDASREFIDDDFVDACRAGDVVRYALNPHDPSLSVLREASAHAGERCWAIAAHHLQRAGATQKQLSAAVAKASEAENAPALAMDLLRVMQHLGFDADQVINVRDGFFEEFEITDPRLFSRVSFDQCYFSKLGINVQHDKWNGPIFRRCEIDELHGVISWSDLPNAVFIDGTNIGRLMLEADTNADIMRLDISLGVRVLMTILRKLFLQAGGGRRESALFRGLDANARAYVAPILEILAKMDFATPHKLNGPVVWVPNRSRSAEAREILLAPQRSSHPLIRQVRAI